MVRKAELDFSSARYFIGKMYHNGEGVPKDYEQAKIWYSKAAKQGNDSAQDNLGLMYAKGLGGSKNMVLAYAWLNISASAGNESARTNRELIEKEMTSAQVAEAQRLASSWKLGQSIPPAH